MAMQRVTKHTLSQTKRQGFTLVELIIVIVVIAILATLTIVAYNGVSARAHASALVADLNQSSKQLALAQVDAGTFPADATTVGLRSTTDVSYSYNVAGDGSVYCLQASGWGLNYFVTSNNTTANTGACSGTIGVPGSGSLSSVTYGVATFIGTAGTSGTTEGTGTAVRLNQPGSITIDPSGNMYITEYGNNCVRKVTPAGVTTQFAGTCGSAYGTANGTGAAASFNNPEGIAYYGGILYVDDFSNGCIRAIDSNQVVTTFAGTCIVNNATSTDGTGSAARFNHPSGLTVDASGNLYVAEASGYCVRKVTPAAVVTTFAGTCGTSGTSDGTGLAARFGKLHGDIVAPSGNIFVGDSSNNCIRMITPAAVVTTFAGTCGTTTGTADGNGAAAQFNNPGDVITDSSGNIYLSDTTNNCIRKITSTAVVTTIAGTCGTAGSADGVGTAALFHSPSGKVFDASGNMFVVDSGNNTVRKLTPQS